MAVPQDLNFSFKSVTTVVQPLLVEDLFTNDLIDNLHQFTVLDHQVKFDKQSVQDLLLDPLLNEDVEEDFAYFATHYQAVCFCFRNSIYLRQTSL